MNTKTHDTPKAITIEINDKELFKSKLTGNLKNSIKECNEAIDEIRYQRKRLVRAMWPDYDWMTHAMDYEWECEKSPFGWCAFIHFTDRAHDHCIFCGDPSERK